jgi:small subunit ribosomal protein S17
MTTQRGHRKTKIGIVVSDKMNKSRVIVVKRFLRHPLYGKFIRKTSKFMIHDEKNESNVGDLIRVMETRPLSKRKRWRLIEIVEKAK